MTVLGIDPGIGRTGWGVLDKGGAKRNINLIGYGCIETPAKTSLESRLLILHEELKLLIEKYKPDIAAVEKLFFNTNVTTAIEIGEARGVVILTLGLCRVKYRSFTPLQVKQAVAGYGRADKIQVQKMVKSLLHLDKVPKPDDAADALALALLI